MERSNFGCFNVFRGKKFLMAIFIVMAFNVSLLSVASDAATVAQSITPQAPAQVITQPPKLPIQGTTILDQKTSNCYFDQYGQIHCPSSGTTSTPAGPLGAACKTTSGASGIWVVTSSASSMICATTGDTCYTPSGGMGKVWGTGSSMKCGGKGDYCPSSNGDGKVFDMGGYLSCLGIGSYCTRTLAGSPCTGCKVVGAPGNYMTFECAKKYLSCPATAQTSVQLAPTNGQAGAPVQVAMNNITHNDASALYCDYILKDVGKLTSYSIPCNGAYANNTDAAIALARVPVPIQSRNR